MNNKTIKTFAPWVLLCAIVIVWQLVCSVFAISEFIFPSPYAIVLALIILTVGLIWLFIRSEGWISKLVVGVLSILSIGAVITYSGASPGAGVLPQAVNTIVASAQQIFNTFTQQL